MQFHHLDRRLAAYPPTPVELDALKAEWDQERKLHELEKNKWRRERIAYDENTVRWRRAMQEYAEANRKWAEEQAGWTRQRERHNQEWREEQERWARERESRNKEWREEADQHRMHEGNVMGLSWSPPESHQCVRYGTREYTARLVSDMKEACAHMPIIVNGAIVNTQHECFTEGDMLVSRWNIEEREASCKPYWGNLYDKGCIGEGSGKHRFEARLWDLHGGEDWMVMCETTPTDIHGHHFDGPTHCDNRGVFYGMVGMWDVDDYQCR
ncbi:hypothetical protein EVJ58_g10908 [Rhodofomes roseus]|uniref:Uncharacterized protein n=1 Tax=Rhodofomes roseus TaxID=34475 RepID=A0A4Y9XL33_9APHY|nr:hypothetical protein EVJ58_g10908 [Rhodofomes roseus]